MNITEKLINVQAELKAPKGQYNSFGKYKYRSCEDIVEAVKPLLKTVGLLLNISDEIVNIGERFYVKATVTVTDGENSIVTTAYAREELEKKGMDGSQVTGAASSYARKYALNGMFAIDDTKDSDATNTHDKDLEPAPLKVAKLNPKVAELYKFAESIGYHKDDVDGGAKKYYHKTLDKMTDKEIAELRSKMEAAKKGA